MYPLQKFDCRSKAVFWLFLLHNEQTALPRDFMPGAYFPSQCSKSRWGGGREKVSLDCWLWGRKYHTEEIYYGTGTNFIEPVRESMQFSSTLSVSIKVLLRLFQQFTYYSTPAVLESSSVVMNLVITDILILSKKERAPAHFTTVCLASLATKQLGLLLSVVRLYSLFFHSSRTLLMGGRQISLKGYWDTPVGTFALPGSHLHLQE